MSIKNFKDAVSKFANIYINMSEILNYLDGVSTREEVVEYVVEPKIIKIKKEEVITPEKPIAVKAETNKLIPTIIEDLGLTNRSYNAMKNNDINSISELISMPRSKLLRLRGIGENSLFEISNALESHGLSLLGG